MFYIELKKARESAGLSQSKLASLLNVSQATVGMWETGRREPSFEMLTAIAKHLGVPAGQLLGETNSTGAEDKKEAAAPECDSQEKELMQLYSALPESDRKQALDYFRFLADRADKK